MSDQTYRVREKVRNSEKLPLSLSSQRGCCLSCSGVGKAVCFCREDQFSLFEVFSPCFDFGFCFPACLFRSVSGGCVVMKSKLRAPLNFVLTCTLPIPYSALRYGCALPQKRLHFCVGQSCLWWVCALKAVVVKEK